jgi:2-oxoisovalerate dehydrogenase E1 component
MLSPVIRVAAKDTFVPSAANLELMALPSVDDLRAGVERVLQY